MEKTIARAIAAGIGGLLTLASCGGPNQQKTGAEEPQNTSYEEAEEFIDPLFEIEGQLCQHVRTIFEDSQGNLWFGTNVYDLMRYDGDSLVYFDEEQGLGGGRINSIIEDDKGQVLISSYQGLNTYSQNTKDEFVLENTDDGMPYLDLWSLLLDGDQNLWIGTTEGLMKRDANGYQAVDIPRRAVKDTSVQFYEYRITSLMEDSEGNIWVGTDGLGITIIHPDAQDESERYSFLSKEDGLADNGIAELMQDRNGNIWIGTNFGGVSLYDGKDFLNFTEKGLMKGIETGAIYEAPNGDIWIALEHDGVHKYDPRDQSITTYGKDDGLLSGGILDILQDSQGRFWFGGWLGLFRFDGEKFEPVTKEGPWQP